MFLLPPMHVHPTSCLSEEEQMGITAVISCEGHEGGQLRCHSQCLQGFSSSTHGFFQATFLCCDHTLHLVWKQRCVCSCMTLALVRVQCVQLSPEMCSWRGILATTPAGCFHVGSLSELCHTMLSLSFACAQGSVLVSYKNFWLLFFFKRTLCKIKAHCHICVGKNFMYLKNDAWICTWIYTNFSGSFEATEKIQAKGGLLTITCTGGHNVILLKSWFVFYVAL